MRLRRAVLSLVLLGVSLPAFAQTPLARITATGLSAGCGPIPENIYHRRTTVPGAGPNGEAVLQLELIPADHANQFRMGWFCDNLPPGAPRYLRTIFRIVPPLDVHGVGDNWTDKFFIIGDPQSDRMIVDLKPLTGHDDLNLMAQKGVGGGPTVRLQIGAWHAAQFELTAAGVKTYLDQPDRSQPTATLTQAFNPAAWNNLRAGFYSNATLAAQGRVVIQILEIEFDTAWRPYTVSGGVPPPAACADGLDNDGDGLTDLNDPGCVDTQDTDETNAQPQPMPCVFMVSPTSATVPAQGGTWTVNVSPAPAGCSPATWTVSGGTSWLTASTTATGVAYTVAANPLTTMRSASLLIAGQTFTVTQAGVVVPTPAGCVSGTVTVPIGDVVVEQLADGTIAQRQAIAARVRALQQAGFRVELTAKSTYTTLWATCTAQ